MAKLQATEEHELIHKQWVERQSLAGDTASSVVDSDDVPRPPVIVIPDDEPVLVIPPVLAMPPVLVMPPVPGEPPLPLVLAAVLAAVVPEPPSGPQPIKPPKLMSNTPRKHFN